MPHTVCSVQTNCATTVGVVAGVRQKEEEKNMTKNH